MQVQSEQVIQKLLNKIAEEEYKIVVLEAQVEQLQKELEKTGGEE